MLLSDNQSALSEFMEQLAVASNATLLLDYDGTLAPFHTERDHAYPYAQVMPLLTSILQCTKSRVVIITGRPIVEIGRLLSPIKNIEIWGSHGLEHLSPGGSYRRFEIALEATQLLYQAESWLNSAGLAQQTEVKPGGLAVHWRGLPAAEVESIRSKALNGLSDFGNRAGLKLLAFEAGLELRVAHPNKGDAIASILKASERSKPIAYLGDDLTDEDAFRVLNPYGLTALVRAEYRETSAQVWLQPPQELINFLQQWLERVSA